MCGIAGEIAISSDSAADLDRAVPMLRAILHRGPDGVGGWQDPSRRFAALHARLAFVDVAGGAQPMVAAAGDAVIVFNGEIYGYARLRRELEQKGARFRTHSDTEVLLELYRQEGAAFLARIEGEFAFALFDLKTGTALLARDPYGVKPLFVSRRHGLLLFGSEIKAILAHPLAERRLANDAIDRRMKGVFLPQETLFEGIEAIEPGTSWTVSRRGVSVRRYHDTDPEACGTSSLSLAEATEAFDEAFGAAVRDRLHGEEPVGLYLSGGADSASVAAHVVRFAEAAPRAFTIDFVGTPESELAAAQRTAAQLGIALEPAPVTPDRLESAFADSIWHTETFVHNLHGTAKWLLSRRAVEEVKAVLTGEGADEFHAGYAYYRHAALLARADSDAELADFVSKHGPYQSIAPRASREARARLAWSNHGGVPYAALRADVLNTRLQPLLAPSFLAERKSAPARALLDWLSVRAPHARRLNDVSLSQLTSVLTDLAGYNLTYLGDRVEMASSLEGRLPFLDRRVTSLLWSLPLALHMGPDGNKLVERAALAARVPGAAGRDKQMFMTPAAPTAAVVAGDLGRRWLTPRAIRDGGVFNPKTVAWLARLVRWLPTRSRLSTQAAGVLVAATSLHALKSMFVDDFEATLDSHARMSLPDLRAALRPTTAPLLAATA